MAIPQGVEEAPIAPEEERTARAGLVRAASVIAAGNIASRVLGLVRETVVAYLFGATGYVSVFVVAATIIQTLYDFLVGGMMSAALVPVFSDYAERKDRDELWRVASIVVNVLAIALAVAALVLEIFARQVIWVLGSGYDPALQDAAVEMIRLILPAVFFLGMSGVITGLLYSLKRFTYPAFTTAAYNAGIVVVALALTPVFGITSLVIGIIVGAALQVALQLPGLTDMHYRFAIDLHHPALRRILRLYAPAVAGLSIMVVGVAIDRNLASHTGAQSLAWMQKATVLTQFPLGLVATAISFAILPELARLSAGTESNLPNPGFHNTLAFGFKLVLILILPSAVGLFILARPIVSLLFEHGAFTALDTLQTSTALRFYLIGLPFAAIDQPLVFAFYARKNTLTPNLVAFLGVAVYVGVALSLMQPLGMIGLVIANSAQLTAHALVMLWLTRTRLGGLRRDDLVPFVAKVALATSAMGVLAFGIENVAGPTLIKVLLPSAFGVVAYVTCLRLLRVRETEQVWQLAYSKVMRLTRP